MSRPPYAMPCPGCRTLIDARLRFCPACGVDTDAKLRTARIVFTMFVTALVLGLASLVHRCAT